MKNYQNYNLKNLYMKDRIIFSIILTLIFCIPFNISEEIVSPLHGIFGEFYIYLYFYLVILLFISIIIFKYKIRLRIPKCIKLFMSLNIISIFISTILNYNNILLNKFKGRGGIEKFLLQLFVLLFILIAIIVIYSCLAEISKKNDYAYIMNNIYKCINYLVWFMIIYCLIQYINMHVIKLPFWDKIESLSRVNGENYFRIRFVSYEASWFGMNLVLMLSYVLSNIAVNLKKKSSWIQLFFILFFIFKTNSRFTLFTALVLILINIFIICRKLNRKSKGILIGSFFIAIAIIVAVLMFSDKIVLKETYIFKTLDSIFNYQGTSYEVSNDARFGMTDAAIKMGNDNIYGVGLGQFGFNFNNYFDNKYYTWQTYKWGSEEYSAWPPVHNFYARVYAELGLLGLISWVGIFAILIIKLIRILSNQRKENNKDIIFGLLLMIGSFIIGFNQDSFINPIVFISLIFSSYILDYNKIEKV